MATDVASCIICLDASPPPIPMGCACRGDGGLAHVDCFVQLAVSKQQHRSDFLWRQCQTCKQNYTGAMRTGLAEAWWSRVAGQAAESSERLAAESNLAQSLNDQGKTAEAEMMLRELVIKYTRLFGTEHPRTLTTMGTLALTFSNQGKHGQAEAIQRELLAMQKRVLGEENVSTLMNTGNLAMSLARQHNANMSRPRRSSASYFSRECACSGRSIKIR